MSSRWIRSSTSCSNSLSTICVRRGVARDLDRAQLLAHQREQLVAVAQQFEIALDQLRDLGQLLGDLVALQAG